MKICIFSVFVFFCLSLRIVKAADHLVAAYNHTCDVINDDTVTSLGRAPYGQLGYGDTNHRGDQANQTGIFLQTVALGTGKTAKNVVAGREHTYNKVTFDVIGNDINLADKFKVMMPGATSGSSLVCDNAKKAPTIGRTTYDDRTNNVKTR